ncbi:MAG: NB-ARC domain-containing protein [Candidatus Brocadiales bacterium]|nr:NB-ARC domain-containing protein [Candidatus Bathyanammoxibius amoris]
MSEKLPIHNVNYVEGIPPGVISKIKDRISSADYEEIGDLLAETDFPDLKEIVCYKDMYRKHFPNTGFSAKEFSNVMDELYGLRCKIAHVRGYFTSLDLDKLLENTRKIARYLGSEKTAFANFVRDIEEHPEKVVIRIPPGFTIDYLCNIGIPNNVPTPDYEYEGGFIGREEDIKKVMQLLEGSLHRVITISGAGGVGKTALALRVIYSLVQQPVHKFDGIIWMSAKEESLSYLGIEDIEPTIKNYEQLLDTIFCVMGFGEPSDSVEKKGEDIQAIFDMHNCILVVIDNLETITDERTINFVLDPHPKTKVLITSRKGLGQVERRYELRQLKEKEAIHLFRQISKDKGLGSLTRLDDKTIRAYVNKVCCYPLAIKWVIGHVAMGKDISSIIDAVGETTSEISRFCFDHIYGELSYSSKKILCALSSFDEPPQAGVLKYVTNIEQRDFEDGIQELILVSLIVPEPYKGEQNQILTRYVLLSLTRRYIRKQIDRDSSLKREIEEKLQEVQATVEEAERAKKQYRFSLSNLGAISEEEKVAAMIVQTAFQKYQAGRYADAVDDYKRALGIAPGFASLYRNWGVMESQEGHSVEADRLMKKAAQLNPNDPQIWLTWGNMKRKGDRIKEALSYYEKAYKLSPDDYVILNALGQAKCRLGEHSEADKLFGRALKKETTGSARRHEIINRTSMAENLKRWSEELKKDRKHTEAEKKLKESLQQIEAAVKLDDSDYRSLDMRREILIELGYFYKVNNTNLALQYFKQAIVNKPSTYKEKKCTVMASFQASQIYFRKGELDKAKEMLPAKLLKYVRDKSDKDRELKDKLEDFYAKLYEVHNVLRGKIISVDETRGFAIIELLHVPGNTYLAHIEEFLPRICDLTEEACGKIVTFIPEEVRQGDSVKKTASNIRFIKEE